MSNGDKSFATELPPDLLDQFDKLINKRGFLKKRTVSVLIRLFLEFPPEIQTALYSGTMDQPLLEIVQKVVDQAIERGYQTGLKLRQKQKPK